MSSGGFRKENEPSNSGTSAWTIAGVIGAMVGVGAAFYYYANKDDEERPAQAGYSRGPVYSSEHRHQENARRTAAEENLREEQARRESAQQRFRERCHSIENCIICFDAMADPNNVWKLPCGHQFHTTCMGKWTTKANKCPVCRTDLQ